MGREGYIRLYRKIWDNPVVTKDAEHLAIWIFLLTEAKYEQRNAMLGGKKITLNPGQFTTGRKQIASATRVTESKVQRVLKLFENERLIEQQTTSRNRLISIINWHEYQSNEQQNERQMNNKRTTNEQQVNTPEEIKKERNKKEKEINKEKEKVAPFDLSDLSPRLRDSVSDWLAYKEERGEGYKPRGFQAWLGQLKNHAQSYEDKHIAEIIERSMSCQYKGVVWEWLKEKPKRKKRNALPELRAIPEEERLTEEERRENMRRLKEAIGGTFK